MAGEVHLFCGEAEAATHLDEGLSFVATQMAELAIVAPVGKPEDRRDMAQRVGHRHPGAPTTRSQHSRQLAQGSAIVRHVLEHRDCERGRAGPRRKRQPLGRAAHPQRAVGDAFDFGKPASSRKPLKREVATDGRRSVARRFDHRVAGAADADVHDRCLPVAQRAGGAETLQVAQPPLLEVVAAIAGELRVEVAPLVLVLRVVPERPHHDDSVHDRETMARVAYRLVSDFDPRFAGRAAKKPGQLVTVRHVVAEVSLSVVLPAFNEARHLPHTIAGLAAALEGSGFNAELVLVDDGSTDGSAEVARAAADGMPIRVLTQANRGRFEARRLGLSAATGDYVLFLDARVRLAADSLRFVHDRLSDEPVWNGHVHIDTDNLFGIFWRLLAELAWRDYFDDPRTTSFGLAEFDRYPKGTTCFLAPRALLESAFAQFRTRYSDIRLANDDTPILREVAAHERIGISPRFACTYAPRTNFAGFLRHALHRGVVFLDGHGTRESRFFPIVIAFFPLSAALTIATLRRLLVAPAALAACGLGAGVYGARAGRSRRELAALALVTPLYAVAHGAGMWRGLTELVRNRVHS